MSEPETSTACNAALDMFKRRDFSGWRGLPSDCSVHAALDYLGADPINAISGRLGHLATQYYTVNIEGYENPVRLWFREETLVMMEAEYPTLVNDLTALQDELAPPSARYNFNWRDFTLPDAQWVYADKGITLVINADNQILLYLTVFTPTTLDQYDQALFLDRHTFRTPRR